MPFHYYCLGCFSAEDPDEIIEDDEDVEWLYTESCHRCEDELLEEEELWETCGIF